MKSAARAESRKRPTKIRTKTRTKTRAEPRTIGRRATAAPPPPRKPRPAVDRHERSTGDGLAIQRVTGAGKTAAVETLLGREWMVTNGLGGYASGTLVNVPTRRFHALLVAALPAPLGRVVMLNQLTERITLPDGRSGEIGGSELGPGTLDVHGVAALKDFRLEDGLPVWRYEAA